MQAPFKSRSAHNRGFTLIELLVVIAIIALLAAILFPVFARVRENARKTSCASNMKQLALGFAQYTHDYDSTFPYAWDEDRTGAGTYGAYPYYCAGSPGSNDPIIWPAKIFPYVKSRQLFKCPSFFPKTAAYGTCATECYGVRDPVWADGDPVFAGSNGYGVNHDARLVGYGYNTTYLGANRFVGSLGCQHVANGLMDQPAKESELQDPAGTILLIDNAWSNSGAGTMPAFADIMANNTEIDDVDFGCTAAGAFDAYDTIPTRHNGGLNVAFTDGHVKWMRKSAVQYRAPIGCYGTGFASTDPKFLWNRY